MITDIYFEITKVIHGLADHLSGGDGMAKGLITVGILSAIGYSCRSVPLKVWILFKRNCTITIAIENTWQGDTRSIYDAVGNFIAENQVSKTFMVYCKDIVNGVFKKSDLRKNPAYSQGMFFYKGKPYYYSSSPAKEMGAQPAMIALTTIGRNEDTFWEVLDIKRRISEIRQNRYYYTPNNGQWEQGQEIKKAAAIFLPKDIKKQLDDKLEFFKNNEDWYIERGIPYKLLIILYGKSGAGKSRLSRYIADYLNSSLGTISSMSSFELNVRSAAMKNIVVSVPDFDTIGVGSKRKTMNEEEDSGKNDSPKEEEPPKIQTPVDSLTSYIEADLGQNLNTILNLFQGDIPLHNSVVVMSTNCIDQIDPALLRRGRTDLKLEIGLLGYDEANAFYQHHYRKTDNLPEELKSIVIKACDLTGAFEDNPFDPEKFIKQLSTY